MCGIVGVLCFTKMGLFEGDVGLFSDLMKVSTVRGTDGAGLFYVGDKNTNLMTKEEKPYTSWIKLSGNAIDLLESDLFTNSLANIKNSRFLIGHNRWATSGKVKADNSHPFESGHITMVHNGTLKSVNGKTNYEQDSQALCKELATKDCNKVLQNIDGAAALVWYDNKENKLKVFRNYERPLWYAKQWNHIYIASEEWMLRGVLDRRNVSLMGIEFKQFSAMTLYEWEHMNDIPVETDIHKPYSKSYGGKFMEYWRGELPITYDPYVPKKLSVVKKDSKILETITDPKIKLVPMAEYWTVKKGDKIIFEPSNVEYLDDLKVRGIIQGTFKDVLPLRSAQYDLLADVTIYAKTHKNPKIPVMQLFAQPFLAGVVESLEINKDDLADIRFNLVNIEGYSADAYKKLVQSRSPIIIPKGPYS